MKKPVFFKQPKNRMACRKKSEFFCMEKRSTKKHIFNSWQGIEVQPVSSDCIYVG